MLIYPYGDRQPDVHPTVFIAPGAMVVGDVAIGAEASVWFNAVIRGDSAQVRVGAGTNVQDGAILHTDAGKPCIVGDDCTIGHRAIVHGCTIGRGSLVGMGSVVLSGAVIGEESLVAAGALVPEGKEFPPRSLLMGLPAKLVRRLTERDVSELIRPGVEGYRRNAAVYRQSLG